MRENLERELVARDALDFLDMMVRFGIAGMVALVFLGVGVSVASSALPPGGTFVDDDGNVHEANIEGISFVGITRGCNPPLNDRFCPGQPVTRGQMAAFLSRALGLVGGSGDRFTDDDGSIFEKDIEAIAAAGITLGCNPPTNDRFCPERLVTRGEMAAFLTRAFDYQDRAGDPFSDDDGSIFESDIERLAAAGVTKGCNPPLNDQYCPNDPVRRDQMASFIARAAQIDPIQVPPRLTPELAALPFAFVSPVQVTAPVGDDRVFIVERGGKVLIIRDGQLLTEPFLDLTGVSIQGGERGLLSVTFHPDFASNGLVYASYSAEPPDNQSDHLSVVAEFVAVGDKVESPSGRRVFAARQPYSNHNGGMIMFGPDGYLYLGLGDGGSANDPDGQGQNPNTVLGSIVRINPVAASADIWATGVRNPWRWWIEGNQMYVADVGQGDREEISVIDLSATAPNLGWNRYEGTRCTGAGSCDDAGLTFPIVEYGHSEGCSITGGVVYHGELTQIDGHFIYGDYCSGWIRSVRVFDGAVVSERQLSELGAGFGLVSFGFDGQGRTYVVRGETVYQLIGK